MLFVAECLADGLEAGLPPNRREDQMPGAEPEQPFTSVLLKVEGVVAVPGFNPERANAR